MDPNVGLADSRQEEYRQKQLFRFSSLFADQRLKQSTVLSGSLGPTLGTGLAEYVCFPLVSLYRTI